MTSSANSARGADYRGTLAALRPGEHATVTALECPDPRLNRRFFDLGFVPGAEVVAVRQAPLRDPIIFRVADCELALRRVDARGIHITQVSVTQGSVNRVSQS